MTDLQLLFKDIHQAKNESDLRSHIAPKIGEYFTAKRSGFFFFNRLVTNPKFKKVLDVALSVEHNNVSGSQLRKSSIEHYE